MQEFRNFGVQFWVLGSVAVWAASASFCIRAKRILSVLLMVQVLNNQIFNPKTVPLPIAST